MFYTLKPKNDSAATHMMNLMRLRHELENEKLLPLPFYYVEKKTFLNEAVWTDWPQMVCSHGNLQINYYDIFNPKHYKNLLYDNEYKNIEHSKTLKPERQALSSSYFALNKIILGTTLLPASIVHHLMELDPAKQKIYPHILHLFSPQKCSACLHDQHRLRRVRVVERYLFLRYQSESIPEGEGVNISRVWAHAWMDYLFYDTEIFYSILKNKNYELPDPPVPYSFRSTDRDLLHRVNFSHAFIIAAFHTPQTFPSAQGLLKERDWHILQLALKDGVDEIKIRLLDRQTRKMVMKVLKDPAHWSEWLQLFEEHNDFEETLSTEDKRDSASPSPSPSPQGTLHQLPEEPKLLLPSHAHGGMAKLNFVMKESNSEMLDMETFERTKKSSLRTGKSMKESEMTDLESQFISPRLGLMTTITTEVEKTPHGRTYSEKVGM